MALELVPEADSEAGATLTAAGLLGGMLVYVLADAWLNRDEGTKMTRDAIHAAAAGRELQLPSSSETKRGESIAVGIFVDGVPESIALGLTIAEGELGLALLAGILIGNVVEAYGAGQPIIAGGQTKRFAILLMCLHRSRAGVRHRARRDGPRGRQRGVRGHRPGDRGRSGPGGRLDRRYPPRLRRGFRGWSRSRPSAGSSSATCSPDKERAMPAHGNQRTEWDAGCRFDYPNPEHR